MVGLMCPFVAVLIGSVNLGEVHIKPFPLFTAILSSAFLICLCTLIATNANNMDSNQIAPLGAV